MIREWALFGTLLTAIVLNLGCGGGSPHPVTKVVDVPPTILSVEYTQKDTFEITFTTPNPEIVSYDIDFRTRSTPFTTLKSILLGQVLSTFTVQVTLPIHLSELEIATFRVGARLSGATPLYSKEASGIIPLDPIALDFMALEYDPSVDGITIKWTQVSKLANESIIEVRQVDATGKPIGDWSQLGSVAPTVVSFLFDRSNGLREQTWYQFRVYNRAGTLTSAKVESQQKFSNLFRPKDLLGVPVNGGIRLTWRNESQAASELVVYHTTDINKQAYGDMFGWEEIAVLPPGITEFNHQPTPFIHFLNAYFVSARSSRSWFNLSDAARVVLPLPAGSLPLQVKLADMPTSSLPPVLDSAGRWYTCWNDSSFSFLGIPGVTDWSIFSITDAFGGAAFAPPGCMVEDSGEVNVLYTGQNPQFPTQINLYHARFAAGEWTPYLITSQPNPEAHLMEISATIDANNHIHVVWRNGPLFTYLTNRDGSWSEEPIQTPNRFSGAWMKLGLVVGSNGEVSIVRSRYDTDFNVPSGFDLIRRTSVGQWTTEALPFESNAVSENKVRMIQRGDRTVFVRFFSFEPAGGALIEECIETLELTPNGWGTPARAPIPAREAYSRYDLALSSDGTRLAILYRGRYANVVAVRENGTWQAQALHRLFTNMEYTMAVAFSSTEKIRLDLGTGNIQDGVFTSHILIDEL